MPEATVCRLLFLVYDVLYAIYLNLYHILYAMYFILYNQYHILCNIHYIPYWGDYVWVVFWAPEAARLGPGFKERAMAWLARMQAGGI